MTADLGPAATPRPVPSPEDRMRDARTDQATPTTDAQTNLTEQRHTPTDRAAMNPGRSFRSWMSDTDRDQLDARAAAAEQERDEALDARDVLRQQLDAMKAAKKRVLGRLEMAEHVIDLIRDGREQQDRALAAWDTQPAQESQPRHPGDALAAALRNAYPAEQLASLHEELVHELDDDAPPENPLGRLVDALFAARWHQQPPASVPPRRAQEEPPVIVLCGSTRFRAEIADANRRLTLAGYIVLAPGVFGHDGDEITDEQKEALDNLHFRKIDLADEVYVVNPGGYIGESTRLEMSYARRTGKPLSRLVEATP